jgi:hypothetical protein
MERNPNENSEPHVQWPFVGLWWETAIGSQDLPGVWFRVVPTR